MRAMELLMELLIEHTARPEAGSLMDVDHEVRVRRHAGGGGVVAWVAVVQDKLDLLRWKLLE